MTMKIGIDDEMMQDITGKVHNDIIYLAQNICQE